MRASCFSWRTTCCQIVVVVVVVFGLLLFHSQGGLHSSSFSFFFQCWFGFSFFFRCVVFYIVVFIIYYSLVLSMTVAQATNIYGAGTPTAGSLMEQLTNGYQFDKDGICKKKYNLLTSSLSLSLSLSL